MKPIISPNIRVRYPEWFVIGAGSVVDDFCYFSCRIEVGEHSHIASGCSIAGGPARQFRLGDYSSLSSGVKVWCSSNDYVNSIISFIPGDLEELHGSMITGDVLLGNFTGVGANSVIMPNNDIPEGTAIGACSFVPTNFRFEPWSVYAGTPIRLVRRRNRERVLAEVAMLEQHRRRQAA